MLEIPDFFFWGGGGGGGRADAGSEPTYAEKNESTPPPPWDFYMIFLLAKIAGSLKILLLPFGAHGGDGGYT